MITIGGRELLKSLTVLIPVGETAHLQLDLAGWAASVTVEFEDQMASQGVRVVSTSNGARITFDKWDNGLGTALVEPQRFAVLSTGDVIEFMAANYRIGGANRLDLQFTKGRHA